ncbi:S8 family serine peptidase (plasmid) [Amphritea atlantica]|uniref:S8 family serine peptidase n=1 Tax=Amphritea atlantica TaxID=355243 RepID=A0ABY5H1E2_9GAMM|nr:S8 family serine peptidase [Amphritea atlantica]
MRYLLFLSALLSLSLNLQAAPPFVIGQVVVKGDPWEFQEYHKVKHLRKSGLTVLDVGPGNERGAIMRLRSRGHWAALNLIANKTATTDDPFRIYQWHFDRIQADAAWGLATGEGVSVAVLDTGLMSGGPDGINSVCPDALGATGGWDIVNDDSSPVDGDGHGTHVSGTIAQATNNGIGVSGLAYNACILPVKVLDDSGSGSFADIAEGIYHAVDQGADVINMSLGISARYGVTNDPVMDPALQYAAQNNVVVVAASGNDGHRKNVSYPAIYPTVIAVGATDARDQVARYSNRGAGLDVVAPGGDTSRDDDGDPQNYPDGVLQETNIGSGWGYYFFQGTSMASPHVAATAALLLSHGAAPDDIRSLLQDNTIDIYENGYDSTSGWGLIQAHDALVAVNSVGVNQPPIAAFQENCNGLSCSFDAGTSFDDGTIVSYLWDFGDGSGSDGETGSTAETISHNYAADGTYDVTLTVEDNDGLSATRTVTVNVSSAQACTDNDADGFCAEIDDCDDSDNQTYPGHNDSKGRWGRNGVDNDCNGIIDG